MLISLKLMCDFSENLSNCYNSTSCSVNFSFLVILVPISPFLLILFALWSTVQILVDKYIFLQQFQGRLQKAAAEESTSQTLFPQTGHSAGVVLNVHIPHPGNLFRSRACYLVQQVLLWDLPVKGGLSASRHRITNAARAALGRPRAHRVANAAAHLQSGIGLLPAVSRRQGAEATQPSASSHPARRAEAKSQGQREGAAWRGDAARTCRIPPPRRPPRWGGLSKPAFPAAPAPAGNGCSQRPNFVGTSATRAARGSGRP